MFMISIMFGSSSVGFLFNTEENANKAFTTLDGNDSIIHITDDFGQVGRINRHSLHGVVVEDMARGKIARAYQMLQQAKAQNEAQKLANADPALNMARGPAVLTPGMNGRM